VTFPARPANIWAGLAKSFELHAVPGDHASMIHRHSDRVADCISACLDQADIRVKTDAG